MARRPDTSSEGSSSQVIDERLVSVKKEKRRPIVEDDEGEERDQITLAGPGDEEDEDEENGLIQNNGTQIDDEDDEAENGENGGSVRKRQKTSTEGNFVQSRRVPKPVLVRDTDGYVPGSIVRMKLLNFLTYGEVEFRPGPFLNLVLGPNGTGKSSIACALCLGLNFDTKLLGRAHKIQSYVKMGNDEGSIELELKGLPGERNMVIVRELHKNMVSERVKELGIQMDNLCTFLPQDKVAEFARMTPQELLKATEEAAGDKNLKPWHDKLISLGQEVSKLVQECEREEKDIRNLESRNKNSEREVQAYRERKEIEDQIKLLELLLPFKEYLDARDEYETLKTRRLALHHRCQRLQERNKPALDLKERLKTEMQVLKQDSDRMRKTAQNKVTSMKDIYNRAENVRVQAEKIESELESLKTREKNRKKKIEALKNEIHGYEDTLANPPPVEDLQTIKDDEARNRNLHAQEDRKKYDLSQEIKEHADREARSGGQIARISSQLERLDSEDGRRLNDLKNWDQHTGTVVEWLRNNQSRFKKRVLEPAALSVSVKDLRFAGAVENGFNASQLKTFVFQCEEDYKLFNNLICDTDQALGRRYRVATWYRPANPNNVAPPPMTREELTELGFQAYAMDLINFPEGMEVYLTMEIRLHRLAIDVERRVDTNRAMDMVTRPAPNGKYLGANFIVGSTMNQVGRSQYGKRLPFNTTREIRQAKSFAKHAVDENQKRQLHQRLNEEKHILEEVRKVVDKMGEQMRAIESHLEEIRQAGQQISQRQMERNKVLQNIQSTRLKLDEKQQQLATEENAPSMETQKAELRRKAFDLAKRRFDLAKELKNAAHAAIDETQNVTRTSLRHMQHSANVAAIEKLLETRDTRMRAAMQEFNQVDEEFKEMRTVTKQKLATSKQMLESADDEVREKFQQIDQSTLGEIATEDVKNSLAELRAKLELSVSANSGVVEQYERRAREIEARTQALQEKTEKKSIKEERIRKLRARWLPALQELVNYIGEKFSAAFDRVGCAGEIRLGQHPDDYDQWRIEILVKFRDTEQLRELTATRQSGGERSLSTIMYLMSLVEHARPPFSLVDEINQGMDQNYERAVHNSLVNVTCAASNASNAAVTSGQYFLVTPKLLTDLNYHPRLKVLCIFNGEWLPEKDENRHGGSLKGMMEAAVRKRAGARTGGTRMVAAAA